MDHFIQTSFRTVFLYVLLLIILRIMGKREVGELGVIDIVVFIIMAEVAAFALEQPNAPLLDSIVPIIILLFIQLLSSYISLKSKKFRDLVDGDPVMVIKDGVIIESEMRKLRYNLDDLFQQLREQQIGSVQDVTHAYLESSGNLSVFTKNEQAPVLALIADGVIQTRHLKLLNKDEKWLREALKRKGIDQVEKIFYCSYEKGHLHYQLKED